MTVAFVLLCLGAAAGVAALGGASGAAAAIWVVHHSSTGERGRFLAELAPLREAVGELGDRFDHFYKRESKRDRDAVKAGAPADSAPGGSLLPGFDRRARLAQLKRQVIGRS